MNTFGLNVIASDKQFYRGRGKSISLPAKDGEITIWAHHADMMIAIVPGEIRFQDEDDRWHTAVAGGGFARLSITVLWFWQTVLKNRKKLTLSVHRRQKSAHKNSFVRNRASRNIIFQKQLWPEQWHV